MTEVIRMRVEAVAAKVREQAGESRQQMAEEWQENMVYALLHMDEQKFGVRYLCYVEWLVDLTKKPIAQVEDKVVMNTLQQLANDLVLVQGKKRSKLQVLSEQNRKETLLPNGIWVWRGHHSRIYKTADGFRVEASIEKYNFAQQMESFINVLSEIM